MAIGGCGQSPQSLYETWPERNRQVTTASMMEVDGEERWLGGNSRGEKKSDSRSQSNDLNFE